MAILVILGIWITLSVPVSLLLGALLRGVESDGRPELYGMDGHVAVFRRGDGRMIRVPLEAVPDPADRSR